MFNTSKVFAVSLLLAVFAAGIGLGFAGSRWSGDRRPPPRRDGRGYAERLQRDLGLSAEQHDSVQAILGRYDPQMRAIFRSVQPAMDSLRQQLHGEIRAALTAEQSATFDSLMARQRARSSRRDSAGPREPRGP